mmetsp:Transcript_19842/g.45063  ORF Transcript_19842/g.45063 Transcript_19842/m.45063 type:complete len:165 (-) Transcript_19842:511-1005(-)
MVSNTIMAKELFSNESVYKGNYVCGKMDGMGIFRSKEGNCYEGYWKDDLYHGHGKLIFSNKTFIGEFSGGEFSNGYLVFFEDGDKKDCYKGSFKSDRWKHCKNFNDAAVSIPEAVFHGRGCRTWQSGNVYEGISSDNARSMFFFHASLLHHHDYNPFCCHRNRH